MSERFKFSRRAMLRALAAAPLALASRALSAEAEAELKTAISGLALDEDRERKLLQVCGRLWTVVELAAEPAPFAPGVVAKALDLSKVHLIKNLDEFSEQGEHYETTLCALKCGKLCAEKSGGREIQPAVYEEAFNEVRTGMSSILNRARERARARGIGEIGPRGMGC
jgi:hypothetical protein